MKINALYPYYCCALLTDYLNIPCFTLTALQKSVIIPDGLSIPPSLNTGLLIYYSP